jgi:hypothetical protein
VLVIQCNNDNPFHYNEYNIDFNIEHFKKSLTDDKKYYKYLEKLMYILNKLKKTFKECKIGDDPDHNYGYYKDFDEEPVKESYNFDSGLDEMISPRMKKPLKINKEESKYKAMSKEDREEILRNKKIEQKISNREDEEDDNEINKINREVEQQIEETRKNNTGIVPVKGDEYPGIVELGGTTKRRTKRKHRRTKHKRRRTRK